MKNFDEIQAAIRKFRDERDWMQFHNPKDMAAAISIEAAELQEIFLWTSSADSLQKAKVERERLLEEIADPRLCGCRNCRSPNRNPSRVLAVVTTASVLVCGRHAASTADFVGYSLGAIGDRAQKTASRRSVPTKTEAPTGAAGSGYPYFR